MVSEVRVNFKVCIILKFDFNKAFTTFSTPLSFRPLRRHVSPTRDHQSLFLFVAGIQTPLSYLPTNSSLCNLSDISRRNEDFKTVSHGYVLCIPCLQHSYEKLLRWLGRTLYAGMINLPCLGGYFLGLGGLNIQTCFWATKGLSTDCLIPNKRLSWGWGLNPIYLCDACGNNCSLKLICTNSIKPLIFQRLGVKFIQPHFQTILFNKFRKKAFVRWWSR